MNKRIGEDYFPGARCYLRPQCDYSLTANSTGSGRTHRCDGTNNNANSLPGPTCTSALDDVARNFITFSTEFDNFFITSIAAPDIYLRSMLLVKHIS